MSAIVEQAAGWVDRAACRGQDDTLFYPKPGEPGTAAKRICRQCAVRTECLLAALSQPAADQHGIWGGLTARERQALLKRRAGLTETIHRTCIECAAPFDTCWRVQRYCSPRCNHLARERRYHARRRPA